MSTKTHPLLIALERAPSQAALARYLAVTPQTLSQWLKRSREEEFFEAPATKARRRAPRRARPDVGGQAREGAGRRQREMTDAELQEAKAAAYKLGVLSVAREMRATLDLIIAAATSQPVPAPSEPSQGLAAD